LYADKEICVTGILNWCEQ